VKAIPKTTDLCDACEDAQACAVLFQLRPSFPKTARRGPSWSKTPMCAWT